MQETIFFSIIVFIFGIVIGSFLNVLIYRLPIEMNVAKGHSFCPSCNHSLKPLDLIPVFSWLFLGRKCRYCKEKISAIYPFVELLNGVLWLSIYLLKGLSINTFLYMAISSCLLVIIFTDMKHMIIPDSINVAIFICGAILLFTNDTMPLAEKLIGMFCISVPMLLIALITKGNGMGGGDIKLMFALGLCIGWKQALFVTFGGAVLGMLYYLIFSRSKFSKGKQVPYGTFLAIAGIVSMMFGADILHWYFHL